MEERRKENIMPVEGMICIPPYEKNTHSIIGHWDEDKKLFIPIGDEIMDRFIKAQWNGYKNFPLIINVGNTEIDGELRTYRSASPSTSERTILHITEENIIMPAYKDIKK